MRRSGRTPVPARPPRGPGRRLWEILDALGSHSATRERRALARIARLGDDVVPDLVTASSRHPNAYARTVALRALARFPPKARRPVLQALSDPAVPVRLWALVLTDGMWTPRAARAVVRLLADPSPGIRANAAAVLARHRVRSAIPMLVHNLTHPRWYVRQHAARALGMLKARAAALPLRRALWDRRKAVRQAAAEALRRIS